MTHARSTPGDPVDPGAHGTAPADVVPSPWWVVVPLKGGSAAKSRLHVARHDEVVAAMADDLLGQLVAVAQQATACVVTGDARMTARAREHGHAVCADPGQGLDAAARAGAALAPAGAPVAVLLGDVPALRPDDLLIALAACEDALAAASQCFVPDAEGTGTVLLAARDAASLRPSFGPGSAGRHAAAGVRLDLPLPRLRRDVDDAWTLEEAAAHGLGPALTRVLEQPRRDVTTPYAGPMQASVHRFSDDGSGSVLLDDGREVAFSPEVFAASALRHLRPGQRVSVTIDDAQAPTALTRLWIVGIGPGETIR